VGKKQLVTSRLEKVQVSSFAVVESWGRKALLFLEAPLAHLPEVMNGFAISPCD
jgi:hypothetical protein